MNGITVDNVAAIVAMSAWNVACNFIPARDSLPPPTPAEREIAGHLREHVMELAGGIGPRNLQHAGTLDRAAAYIEDAFVRARYRPRRQTFSAEGRNVANLEAERGGSPGAESVIVGAHYDSVDESPGANDNGSGVAVLLELARLAAAQPAPTKAVRFVAFVNEEPPYFMTDTMGSLVYARAAAARGERTAAMISLETLGCFSDAPGSQQYPKPFSILFPDRGNFVAMVSNVRSAALLRRVRDGFRSTTRLPVIASPAPERIPGIGWSDHWSFWQHGIPAVMLTDTAPYRYPYYHTREDTPDKIDYERLARVVTGCRGALNALTRG